MSLKNLTDTEYYAYLEDHGHVLRRDENGKVDDHFLECEYHNGPGCVRCRACWCEYCRPATDRCIESYTAELFPFPAAMPARG